MSQERATLVLDIGKTNAKLTLLGPDGALLAEERTANAAGAGGPYPHLDTERLWPWMLAAMRRCAGTAPVGAIVPVTHGAAAALIDTDGLVLPVLDYESSLPEQADDAYALVRPAFAETCSPALPGGLNLGRQLFWQWRSFPADCARVKWILPYPQYWAWRLCGVAATEVTSLGCHTDLWAPAAGTWSTLGMDWRSRFAPLRRAWEPLGPILPALAAQTGLPPACQVLCGIHDSNASLLPHLHDRTATVLSTGTWLVAASFGTPLQGLDAGRAMLANVDVLGRPVACMRFMAGRAFEQAKGDPARADAATRDCALRTHACLDALGATGPIIIEGSFTRNPQFARLLAALRPRQRVTVSTDTNGTSRGAWLLHHWGVR